MFAIGKLIGYIGEKAGKLGLLIIVAVLAVQGYMLIRPRSSDLDAARGKAADRLTAQVADILATQQAVDWTSRYVRVARLAGDYEDHVRQRFEKVLPARTNCRMVSDTLLDELRDQIAAKAARLGILSEPRADSWKLPAVRTLDEALAFGEHYECDYVLYGEVHDFRSLGERVFLKMDVAVADVAQGARVFQQAVEAGDPEIMADVSMAALQGENQRAGLRLGLWLVFTLLLPVCTWSLWRVQLERESRVVNGLCLAALTLLPAALAWGLMGFSAATALEWLTLALALGLAGCWNLYILSVIERRRVEERFGA